jgi:uncharacterized protein (TIGR04222 family)
MSPFDLRGPEFLVFYMVLGSFVLLVLFVLNQTLEPVDAIRTDLSDPYLISYLRGGNNELLRVATISLLHRGLLKVSTSKWVSDFGSYTSDKIISIAAPNVVDAVRTPLERELLSHFAIANDPSSVFSQPTLSNTREQYDEDLKRLGLLPDESVRINRWLRLGLSLAVLWGIAVSKIAIALSRGHKNIGFLIALSILFGFLAYRMTHSRLTRSGEAMLADLRLLFSSLKKRSNSASENWDANELTLLAAVFGIAAIPTSVIPYARTLYPRAVSSDSSGDFSGSSCGSSSCGGGGSSSCGGGGGCGGGGCGGCGS